MSEERLRIDVSGLPTAAFGLRPHVAWGTLAFMMLEGTGFALAIGAYFYLQSINTEWPLGVPAPDLAPGTALTLLMLLSEIPNYFLKKQAKKQNIAPVRMLLLVMCLVGLLLLVIRAYEFPALNASWDTNAYGSIVWFLLGLHTTHLLTDVGDTLVLTALMFTRHGHKTRRFSDVEDNGFYWDFVVLTWLPIYAVIYWVPRW